MDILDILCKYILDYTCEEDRRQEKSLIGKSVQLLHDYQCYGASRHQAASLYPSHAYI